MFLQYENMYTNALSVNMRIILKMDKNSKIIVSSIYSPIWGIRLQPVHSCSSNRFSA